MGEVTRTNFGIGSVTQLTNAQILALPTTPITLVEAIPGAIIVPHMIGFLLSPWVADYTNIDGAANLDININSVFTPATFVPGAILAQGAATVIWCNYGREYDFLPNPIADLMNFPLVLSADNAAAGNFTGGNATQILTVQAFYEVLRIPA